MANNKKANGNKKKTQKEINYENLQLGIKLVNSHSLFGGCFHCYMVEGGRQMDRDAYAIVSSEGRIRLNENAALLPEQWAYVIAHTKLHLAFGHFDADKMPGYTVTNENGEKQKKVDCNHILWNMACDIYIDRFLTDLKFGKPFHNNVDAVFVESANDEIRIYEYLVERNIPASGNTFGTAGVGRYDMVGLENPIVYNRKMRQCNEFARDFGWALARSVSQAVSTAGGCPGESEERLTKGKSAAKWFVNHYPLLGGLASHFRIIEDYSYCNMNEIQIAAVDVTESEIYLNPAANLSEDEWRFVLAHEYLHAGLMHHERCRGRDHYLWNVACDFVINGWLRELRVGTMPAEGLLYDESLKGMSAESVYDMILSDMRKYEKMNTFRGYHKGDVIGDYEGMDTGATSLDDFCKSAMQQGLEYHISSGRGLIPAGLIEEIRALSMPPIPWDVALAKWFDVYFAPLEKHRTYARPSRRQASTPDIPRPRYNLTDVSVESRTYGVVIDTSGSMNTKMIGKALGAIASYSSAHEVPFARVVFCDATAYDAGYVSPEDIAGRVQVKGRGGTRLQPGIDTLEQAKDFPKDGPILIITDGAIEEHLDIKRNHAYLMPMGCRLPFRAKGEVFLYET